MRRGTTPTITVTLDTDASELDVLYVTLAQLGKVLIEKALPDGEVTGATVNFPLTQNDTLKLAAYTQVEIQVRGRVGVHAFASDVLVVSVEKILKDGVI